MVLLCYTMLFHGVQYTTNYYSSVALTCMHYIPAVGGKRGKIKPKISEEKVITASSESSSEDSSSESSRYP